MHISRSSRLATYANRISFTLSSPFTTVRDNQLRLNDRLLSDSSKKIKFVLFYSLLVPFFFFFEINHFSRDEIRNPTARRPIMAFITDCSYSTPAVSDGKSIESYLTRLYELKIHAWLILNDLPRTCFNSLFFSTLRVLWIRLPTRTGYLRSVDRLCFQTGNEFIQILPSSRVFSWNSS